MATARSPRGRPDVSIAVALLCHWQGETCRDIPRSCHWEAGQSGAKKWQDPINRSSIQSNNKSHRLLYIFLKRGEYSRVSGKIILDLSVNKWNISENCSDILTSAGSSSSSHYIQLVIILVPAVSIGYWWCDVNSSFRFPDVRSAQSSTWLVRQWQHRTNCAFELYFSGSL